MRLRILGALGLAMVVTGIMAIVWSYELGETVLGIVGSCIALGGMVLLTKKV